MGMMQQCQDKSSQPAVQHRQPTSITTVTPTAANGITISIITTMRPSTAASLLACTAAQVHAFSDSSPFILFSTAKYVNPSLPYITVLALTLDPGKPPKGKPTGRFWGFS